MTTNYVRSQLQEDELEDSQGPIDVPGMSMGTATTSVTFPRQSRFVAPIRNLCRGRTLSEKFLFYTAIILVITTIVLAALLHSVTCPDKCLNYHCPTIKHMIINNTRVVVVHDNNKTSAGCPTSATTKSTLPTSKAPPTQSNICVSPSCVATAAKFLQYMNATANPCEDFYEFACGSFKKYHSISSGHTSTGAVTLRDDINSIALHSLLENNNLHNSLSTDNKARVVFQSCMNVSAREKLGIKSIQPYFATSGPWVVLNSSMDMSSYDPYTHMLQLDTNFTGIVKHALFELVVGVDNFNSSRYVFVLNQPNNLLLSPDNYRNNRTKSLNALKDTIIRLIKFLGIDVNPDLVQSVIDFENKLAGIFVPEELQRESSNQINVTLDYVNKHFDCGKFRWLDMMHQRIRKFDINYDFNLNSTVMNVGDVGYFPKMCSLMNDMFKTNQGKSIFNAYMMMKSFLRLFVFLTPEVEEVFHKMNSITEGVHGVLPRTQQCVDIVSNMYGFPLGSMFVRELFDKKSKDAAIDIVANVRSAFRSGLEKLTWMDPTTLTAAKKKLDAMRASIGYNDNVLNETYMSETYGDVDLSPDTYLENAAALFKLSAKFSMKTLSKPVEFQLSMVPQKINAYYQPTANAIAFPAAILQDPFFNNDVPLSVSFGAIGSVIGHEITHGFDDQGREYDSVGNLRNWWTNDTAKEFASRAECILKQYESYRVEGFAVKGKLVLGESIADCGGLKAAYNAFKAKNIKVEKSLPGLNYSPEQMFFISFAQSWCELRTTKKTRELMETDPHPPGSMRVWGSVSNLAEFASAFRCPSGSKMAPTNRCSVW